MMLGLFLLRRKAHSPSLGPAHRWTELQALVPWSDQVWGSSAYKPSIDRITQIIPAGRLHPDLQ